MKSLQAQETALANFRLRASWLLVASALGGSFTTAAARIGAASIALPGYILAGLALVALLGVAVCTFRLIKPRDFWFWPHAESIFEHAPNVGEAQVKAVFATGIMASIEHNRPILELLARLIVWDTAFLALQIAFMTALAAVR